MDQNYAYQLRNLMRVESKNAKKDNKKISERIKNEFDIILKNMEGTSKLEVLYKFRYAVFNAGITNSELENIYIKLLKKIAFTDEKSVIFADWNNVFSMIFGNIFALYNEHGKYNISKIIDLFCNTKNEIKMEVLMMLFIGLFNVETRDFDYIDLILENIRKTDNDYILKSYKNIIKNICFLNDENFIISKYKDYIAFQFSESRSKYNSEMLSELLDIFADSKRNINNVNLINLFKVFSNSDNRDLINAYYELMNNHNFTKCDYKIQNRCINILKNIPNIKFLNMRLTTEIILEIIVVCDDEYIQDYLLEKLKYIKNYESLKLILMLTPILNEYSSVDEYVRVIDNLEDKNSELTKKLVINLNYDEEIDTK